MLGASFADEHEREVRERRQVAARAHRSARRVLRMHAGVDHGDERVDGLRTNAGESLGQDIRAKRGERAHDGCLEQFADTGGMTPQKIDLQLRERVVRNRDVCQRAEPGVDAVHGPAGARMRVNDRARGCDSRAGGRRERHALAIERDSRERIEAERISVKFDHW